MWFLLLFTLYPFVNHIGFFVCFVALWYVASHSQMFVRSFGLSFSSSPLSLAHQHGARCCCGSLKLETGRHAGETQSFRG